MKRVQKVRRAAILYKLMHRCGHERDYYLCYPITKTARNRMRIAVNHTVVSVCVSCAESEPRS